MVLLTSSTQPWIRSMLSRISSTCHWTPLFIIFLCVDIGCSSFSSIYTFNSIILFPSQHKKFIFCFSLLLLSIIWPIPMYHLSGRVWKRKRMNGLWSRSVVVRDNLCVEQLVMLFEMCAWVEPPRIWLKQHNNDVIFSFWANFLLWKMTKLKKVFCVFAHFDFHYHFCNQHCQHHSMREVESLQN